MIQAQMIHAAAALVLGGAVIAACDGGTVPAADEEGRAEAVPEPAYMADTVDSLAADPERLREVMRRCKADDPAVGPDTCAAASRAYRRRFMGDGRPTYSPEPVDLFPATPEAADAGSAPVGAQPPERRPE